MMTILHAIFNNNNSEKNQRIVLNFWGIWMLIVTSYHLSFQKLIYPFFSRIITSNLDILFNTINWSIGLVFFLIGFCLFFNSLKHDIVTKIGTITWSISILFVYILPYDNNSLVPLCYILLFISLLLMTFSRTYHYVRIPFLLLSANNIIDIIWLLKNKYSLFPFINPEILSSISQFISWIAPIVLIVYSNKNIKIYICANYFKILNWGLLLSSLGIIVNCVLGFVNAEQYVDNLHIDFFISTFQGGLVVLTILFILSTLCALNGIFAKNIKRTIFIIAYSFIMLFAGIILVDDTYFSVFSIIYPILVEVFAILLILSLVLIRRNNKLCS